MNENLQLKNEVDIMNLLLSNNESKNLINSIYDLKKTMKKKDKNDEEKKEIKENKEGIKLIIDKYFEELLSKLTVDNIIREKIHVNVFNEFELIKKYGIYSLKDLQKLTNKVLEERADDDKEERRYNNYYDDDEYDRYFGEKTEKSKIMKKSASAEIKSSKDNGFKKSINIKFDNLKSKIKKSKKELIYDNSYLFKDNHSDNDETNNIVIRKEIQEILNKEYNEIIKAKKEEIIQEKKRKNREFYLKKNVPFQKKKKNRNIIRLTDDSTDEVIIDKNKNETSKIDLEKEKIRDKKIYEFFGKIQKLKRRQSINNENLNKFIDQQIELNIKAKNHTRLFHFLEDFNLNRTRAKFNNEYKNKKIGFLSPIIFTSPNENSTITNLKSYK